MARPDWTDHGRTRRPCASSYASDAPSMTVIPSDHGLIMVIEQMSGFVELSAADLDAALKLAHESGMIGTAQP